MMITIRKKLIGAISLLMVVTFTLAAMLFISEKKDGLAEDIYSNMKAFAKLTAPTVVYNYDLYLAQDSFVYFNREMQEIFEQNDDLLGIEIISYEGEKLYDSLVDTDKRYEGEERLIEEDILSQVQAENIAVQTEDGRVVFLKGDLYVDRNENFVESLEFGVMIEHLVVPADEKYSVLYKIDYSELYESVAEMRLRIIYLAIFAVMLGMMLSFVMSGQLTRPIKKLVQGAGEIAKGNFKNRVDIHTRDELNYLGGAFNKMAEDLEKSMEARIYKERVAHELKIATDIQKQIIPDKIPEAEGIDIAAGIIPASEIGGDMYDFLPHEDRLRMYIGDVTGHGVPAGIVSSLTNALFFAYSGGDDLKQMVVNVNKVLKAKTMSTMFMTLCFGEWDLSVEKFRYVNAGHEQILHYRASDGRTELAPSKGIALGMVDDVSDKLQVDEIELAKGDFLVLYSDGIPEAKNGAKETYSIQRFSAVVQKFGNLENAEAMKEAILADVKQFVGDTPQSDDITLIVLKRV